MMDRYRLRKGVIRLVASDLVMNKGETRKLHPRVFARHADKLEPAPKRGTAGPRKRTAVTKRASNEEGQ